MRDNYSLGVSETRPNHRAKLGDARLLLIFTPEAVREADPLERLSSLLPHVDIVQVRPKPVASGLQAGLRADPPAEARASYEWTERVLELVNGAGLSDEDRPLVMVNDRVDVAMALAADGCAGVHLGEGDLPAAEARAMLPEELLIGLSTHDMEGVVASHDEPVDYLGFGPVFASETKGYADARGPERAWVAAEAASVPVFAIGGVTASNAGELESVGRVAVASALLAAPDPAAEAARLRRAIEA